MCDVPPVMFAYCRRTRFIVFVFQSFQSLQKQSNILKLLDIFFRLLEIRRLTSQLHPFLIPLIKQLCKQRMLKLNDVAFLAKINCKLFKQTVQAGQNLLKCILQCIPFVSMRLNIWYVQYFFFYLNIYMHLFIY